MKKYFFAKNISGFLIKLLSLVDSNKAKTIGGKLLLKMYPDFLRDESKKIGTKICVTGTNGKTAISEILEEIIKVNGTKNTESKKTSSKILTNDNPKNLPAAISACLLKNKGKYCNYGVFKCDEMWLLSLFKTFQTDYFVISNVCSGRNSQFGGCYRISKTLKKAVDKAKDKNPNVKILMNADDPHLLPVISDDVILFGVEKIEGDKNLQDYMGVKSICTCGFKYSYEEKSFSQLGHYYCENCKNSRPEPKYKGEIILNDNGVQIKINNEITLNSKLIGIINGYNILAAAATALEMGISSEDIQKGLDNYNPPIGMKRKFKTGIKNVFAELTENPASANQAIKEFFDKPNSTMLIALNDTVLDGKDISWLYDSEFERLKEYTGQITVSGTIANELALRLKHAGVSEEKIFLEPNIKKGYKKTYQRAKLGETVLIMGSQSALDELKKVMK